MSFVFLSFCLVISSFCVIFNSNPVFSVLSLILVFCNTAGLFFIINADYIAFIYIIVYMGAIIVLFLFTIMMLDTSIISINYLFSHYSLISVFIIIMCCINVFKVISDYIFIGEFDTFRGNLSSMDINSFGQLIYTYFFLSFIILSFILFNSMLGAIVLTMLNYSKTKRQNVFYQTSRDINYSIIFKKIIQL